MLVWPAEWLVDIQHMSPSLLFVADREILFYHRLSHIDISVSEPSGAAISLINDKGDMSHPPWSSVCKSAGFEQAVSS